MKKFVKLHESKQFSTAATLEASDYFLSGMGIKMNEKGNYFSNTKEENTVTIAQKLLVNG